MYANIESLTTELIELPKEKRLEIVRFLLFLDSRPLNNSNSIDSTWEKEISERVRAVDEGTAIRVDYEEVMQDIELRFA
jgi:hypothetical protein